MITPKKTYYSIREVCQRTGLEPHVLRYWENEFSQLRPKKNRAGNRAYREKDIEVVEAIKALLYEEQFTISGAKRKMAEQKEAAPVGSPSPAACATPPQQPDGHDPQARRVIEDAVVGLRDVLKTLRSAGAG